MKRFEIGDKVVALSSTPNEDCQPRVKGNVYTVLNVIYCSSCGAQSINITGINVSGEYSGYMITRCRHRIFVGDLHYTTSDEFIKQDDLQSELEEALEREDYETAVLIRDLEI